MRLHILTEDPLLRRALSSHLATLSGLTISPETSAERAADGDVIVTTTSSCPPDQVAAFLLRGIRTIILAAIPREPEQARYGEAGAIAYVPIAVDGSRLMSAIRRALGTGDAAAG